MLRAMGFTFVSERRMLQRRNLCEAFSDWTKKAE
jgi:hypothetical protein